MSHVHTHAHTHAHTQIAGAPGSGKTQLCLTLAIAAVLAQPTSAECGQSSVMYIDTEGAFSAERCTLHEYFFTLFLGIVLYVLFRLLYICSIHSCTKITLWWLRMFVPLSLLHREHVAGYASLLMYTRELATKQRH